MKPSSRNQATLYTRPTPRAYDSSLETRIDREIEAPGIPLLRKLASGDVNLDFKQRSAVARLVGLQHVRVPYERSFIDKNNVDNLRAYIEEMDEASRRLSAPVNAIDVAITPHDDPKLIKHWSRFTRAQILSELKEAEEDPHKSSRESNLILICIGHLSQPWIRLRYASP